MTDADELYGRMQAILPEGRWIEDIWSLEPVFVAVFGDNLIHIKGFFPDLAALARAYGDSRLYLLDAEEERRFLEFSLANSEDEYMAIQSNAPGIAPGWGFPFDLCRQAFLGGGAWLLLSDRDAERMCFLSRYMPGPEQMVAIWRMFRFP